MSTLTNLDIAWNLWKEEVTVNHIAERCDVHRATVYRWIYRFRTCGIKRTKELYRNAKKRERRKRIDPVTKVRIIQLRKKHRGCCGQKIRKYLKREYNEEVSLATIYRVLRGRYKLSSGYKPRRAYGKVPIGVRPYDVMQVDTVDFGEVHAYTFIDTYTREANVILRPTLQGVDGAIALQRALRSKRYRVIQTDGGSEFEKEFIAAIGNYTKEHRVSRPYKKNEQAYIESFNRTVRKECLGWLKYQAEDIPRLQKRVDEWLRYYHEERLHIGLDYLTPQEFMDSCRI